MMTSIAEVQKVIDEALGEEIPQIRSVPDRETWGSTPEDIQSQLKMQQMAERSMAKRPPNSEGKRQGK